MAFKLKDNYHVGSLVSTVFIEADGIYQTAIFDRRYIQGNLIIVEQCDSQTKAEIMHDKWYEILEDGEPELLKDVLTSKKYYLK